MLAMLVRPRLRARGRPDQSAEMNCVRGLGSTVFCFVGRDGIIQSITPNARQVLGEACDRAADLGLTFAELTQPDDRQMMADWIAFRKYSAAAPPVASSRARTAGFHAPTVATQPIAPRPPDRRDALRGAASPVTPHNDERHSRPTRLEGGAHVCV